MAFKDNIGMTEELEVEMVNAELPSSIKISAKLSQAVEVTWIDDSGAVIRVSTLRYLGETGVLYTEVIE